MEKEADQGSGGAPQNQPEGGGDQPALDPGGRPPPPESSYEIIIKSADRSKIINIKND